MSNAHPSVQQRSLSGRFVARGANVVRDTPATNAGGPRPYQSRLGVGGRRVRLTDDGIGAFTRGNADVMHLGRTVPVAQDFTESRGGFYGLPSDVAYSDAPKQESDPSTRLTQPRPLRNAGPSAMVGRARPNLSKIRK